MQKIKKLSLLVSSKIAAGEVCERPINAIKELLENSIDAHSTDIKIEIQDGGLSLISINDNGDGIDKDDLPLAIERFATSKAVTLDEVYSASTFGFRGEALAAISAVSDFTLKSGVDDSNIYELKTAFGADYDIAPAAGLKGTTITVKNLFENFPARRKFLKSAKSLEAEVIRFIKYFALINHNISLRLTVNNKQVFNIEKNDNTLKKVSNLFTDKEFNSSLYEHNGIKILATVTNPNCSDRFKRDAIIIGVNGRLIQDKSLVQAVCQAYSRRVPDGRFPIAVIDISIDPKLIDANVHPSKLEVRFERPRDIFSFIIDAVNSCFANMNVFADYTISSESSGSSGNIIYDKKDNYDYDDIESIKPDNKQFFVREDFSISRYNSADIRSAFSDKSGAYETFNNNISYDENENDTTDFNYDIIGQIGKTYILLESGDDIIFIDQHVAHERILYEEKLERDRQIKSSIVLHDPIKLNFDTETVDDIFADIDVIMLLGYVIERVKGDEIIIKHIPSSLARKDIEREFRKTISELFQRGVTKSYDRRVLSLSCKKAIKAGDGLSIEEMRYLIDELNKCKNNSTCPHGRPITFKMSLKELGSRFYR